MRMNNSFSTLTTILQCTIAVQEGVVALVYIRDGITFVKRDLDIQIEDCNMTSVFLQKQNLTIYEIYRPPRSCYEIFITQLDKILERQKSLCIIVGDINLDLLKKTATIAEYKNVIKTNAFNIQKNISQTNATRTTKTTKSIIDHVLANKNLECDLVLEENEISDHNIIMLLYNNIIIKHTLVVSVFEAVCVHHY